MGCLHLFLFLGLVLGLDHLVFVFRNPQMSWQFLPLMVSWLEAYIILDPLWNWKVKIPFCQCSGCQNLSKMHPWGIWFAFLICLRSSVRINTIWLSWLDCLKRFWNSSPGGSKLRSSLSSVLMSISQVACSKQVSTVPICFFLSLPIHFCSNVG